MSFDETYYVTLDIIHLENLSVFTHLDAKDPLQSSLYKVGVHNTYMTVSYVCSNHDNKFKNTCPHRFRCGLGREMERLAMAPQAMYFFSDLQ